MTKQRETREQVLELIETLEVGDAIPSERVLSIDLGVSRLTLRAALDDLVREGHLTRRRGAGTFVAEPKVAKGMTISSFSDDMRRRGLTPGSRTLEFQTVPAGARLGRILHVSPSEPVLAVKRLRSADAEPMALELLHVPEALFPGLTARDLEESSFYDMLEERYGIEIVGGTQTVEPTVTNDEESAALGVPLHSPALLFERVTRSSSGEIVEFTSSIYRGDRYRLVSELGVGGRPAIPIGLASRPLDGFA
ncbi:MAG TPA: GntR family transcriptional regulator [Gaiellaceae bacterium]|nr:GntR family transcriptional regulator [Gaiellaceae bacterium]